MGRSGRRCDRLDSIREDLFFIALFERAKGLLALEKANSILDLELSSFGVDDARYVALAASGAIEKKPPFKAEGSKGSPF